MEDGPRDDAAAEKGRKKEKKERKKAEAAAEIQASEAGFTPNPLAGGTMERSLDDSDEEPSEGEQWRAGMVEKYKKKIKDAASQPDLP